MAGLSGILRLQWVAYWRRISRAGAAGKNNLVILGIFTLMAAARYFTFLKDVTGDTHKGRFGGLELLSAAAMAVCLAPVWDEALKNIGPRDLSRFPLSARARLISRMWARFISPFSWIAALFCLSLFAPLFASPNPASAVASGVALLWMSSAAGVGFSHLLATARGKSALLALMGALVLGAAAFWLRMGPASAAALSWLPSHLVAVAAAGSWPAVAWLAAFALAGTYFALASLSWMLEAAPATVSRKAVSSPAMTVFRKELRYFARMERPVWLLLAAFAFYLATAAAPEPDALRAVLLVTSVFTVTAATNSFGPDGVPGLDRYGLLPLAGGQIIATKNRASATLAFARWSPILALAFWRFGWREGMYGTVEAASLALASMAWGNVTSVRHPSSGDDAGTLLDQVFALAASGLPGALSIGILRGPASSVAPAMFGMLAVCALLYVVSLRWAASYYSRSFDVIREWLS